MRTFFLGSIMVLLFTGCQSVKRDRPEIPDLNTPEHQAKVKEVERLLMRGQGYHDLGDYDSAHHEFNRVLAIDPYNQGARSGIDMAKRAKALSMQPSVLDYRGRGY